MASITLFAGRGGSVGDTEFDNGKGAIVRLTGAGLVFKGLEELKAEALRVPDSCRYNGGRVEALEETLPALSCCSRLCFEPARLPWQLELDGGLTSWDGRFVEAAALLEKGVDNTTLPT